MRPSAKLIRLDHRWSGGIFGALILADEVFCATLEPPYLMNKPFESGIPNGQYMCDRVLSPKFGETFEICHVPDRDHVYFHAGNRVEDTEGCVILGQYWGKLFGDRAVLNSGKTFKKFMGMLVGVNSFSLTVRVAY